MTWQSRRHESHAFKAGLNSALGFHQHYGLCSKVVQVTVVYMEDYIFPLILRFLKWPVRHSVIFTSAEKWRDYGLSVYSICTACGNKMMLQT